MAISPTQRWGVPIKTDDTHQQYSNSLVEWRWPREIFISQVLILRSHDDEIYNVSIFGMQRSIRYILCCPLVYIALSIGILRAHDAVFRFLLLWVIIVHPFTLAVRINLFNPNPVLLYLLSEDWGFLLDNGNRKGKAQYAWAVVTQKLASFHSEKWPCGL